jgi:hypothetical protein
MAESTKDVPAKYNENNRKGMSLFVDQDYTVIYEKRMGEWIYSVQMNSPHPHQ